MEIREAMKSKVAFFITPDQVEALKTLGYCRAAWPAFGRATWLALVKKGLVKLDPKPRLTPAGTEFLSVNRLLEAVNRASGADEPDTPCAPAHAQRARV